MRKIKISELHKVCKKKGYVFFQKGSYNLNIFGIRSEDPVLNKFSCAIFVAWIDRNGWDIRQYPATTLPGKYYLINRLLNKKGCAILIPGQYRGAYRIGKHRGRYDALVQSKPVKVFRDGDRDNEFDYDLDTSDVGYFGINIHRAGRDGSTPKVGRHSAGCQVFQRYEDFIEFMSLCDLGAENWGNSFTYTLLEESELNELLQ